MFQTRVRFRQFTMILDQPDIAAVDRTLVSSYRMGAHSTEVWFNGQRNDQLTEAMDKQAIIKAWKGQ